jgi:hypothetical protein
MALPDIFTKEVSEEVISRIQKLTPETPAQWGKMNVSQMLAHCNVTYEYIYDDKYKKPKGITKIILKLLVKPLVVNEKPYKQSNPTAPDFRIVDERDFLLERERLMGFIRRVQCDGAAHFDGKESHSFGKLSKNEWNNMFYKHLNHHLTQFGV